MNGSTVGERDANGQVSGKWVSCGLYAAYGAQFMMGSSHTMAVVAMTMSSTGCLGYRCHMTTKMTTSAMTPIAVPSSRVGIQSWWKREATGRRAVNRRVSDAGSDGTTTGVVLNGDDADVGQQQRSIINHGVGRGHRRIRG